MDLLRGSNRALTELQSALVSAEPEFSREKCDAEFCLILPVLISLLTGSGT